MLRLAELLAEETDVFLEEHLCPPQKTAMNDDGKQVPGVRQSNYPPASLQLPVLIVNCDESTVTNLVPGTSGGFTAPRICKQAPSDPPSPTSPRSKRPSPLPPDSLQRIHMLTANHAYDLCKLSPMSPGQTSDLGSSARSSLSMGPGQNFGARFHHYRDQHHGKRLSVDYSLDGESYAEKSFLSPSPFSPFSDCSLSPYMLPQHQPVTPNRPVTLTGGGSNRSLHFNFERPPSSLHPSGDANTLHVPVNTLRERCSSDSQVAASVAAASQYQQGQTTRNHQFKKRLLKKYESEQSEPTTRSRTNIDVHTGSLDVPLLQRSPFHHSATLHDKMTQFEAFVQQQMMSWHAQWYKNGTSTMLGIHVSPVGSVTMPDPPPSGGHHSASSSLASSSMSIPQQLASATSKAAPLVAPFGHTSRMGTGHAPGPLKAAAWRRSRSESDVIGNYSCEHCGQMFSMQDRLAKHIASRHRNRRSTSALAKHAAGSSLHQTDGKAHRCTICKKSFGRSDMLTRHLRLHTGDKPYECRICGQEFSRSDHLSTHQRTHTGEKPYQCPQCSYAASRRDMITRHMKTHNHARGGPMIVHGLGGLGDPGGGTAMDVTMTSEASDMVPQFPTFAIQPGAQGPGAALMARLAQSSQAARDQIGQLAGSIDRIRVEPEPE